jgi:hypothetical protein
MKKEAAQDREKRQKEGDEAQEEKPVYTSIVG